MGHDPDLIAIEPAEFTALVQHVLDTAHPDAAMALCRKKLSLDPADTEALRHLGSVYAVKGLWDEALAALGRAAELASADPRCWSDLGRVQAMSGKHQQAVTSFERAVRLQPDFSDGWHNLGTSLHRMRDTARAFDALKQALKTDPTRADTYLVMGRLLMEAGQLQDAMGCFERAARYDPGRFGAATQFGHHLTDQGDILDAADVFKHAVNRDPNDPEAWFGLGRALEDLGEREAAGTAYRNALSHNPGHGMALSQLLALSGETLEHSIRDYAEQALISEKTPDTAKSLIGYGLAKHFDRLRDFEAAARAGSLANSARRREHGALDRAALTGRIDGLIASYDESFFRQRRGFGVGTDQPVFIVGLPRSGTTLCEQILSSHPRLSGAGELPDLRRLLISQTNHTHPHPWQATATVQANDSLMLADEYLHALRKGRDIRDLRISDKSPLNFFSLAFAALLFPNARVIHCSRDIRDNGLSIWMENFNPDQQWDTDFDDMAFYVQQYRRLMAHWQKVLPLPILEFRYEETVSDLEAQARRLMNFLEVPWNDTCLDFHQSGRAVQTPSRWQVRQPIYSRSVGRWRNYAGYLPELESALSAI